MAPKQLKGSVALVTGGAKRIGNAIALALAKRGAHVAITYNRSKAAADRTVRQLRSLRVRVLAVHVDQSDVQAVQQAVRGIEKKLGRIDLLVNNASNFYPTPLSRVTQGQWDDLVHTNLRGPFFFCQAVSRGMLKRKRGRIVNVADVAAFSPWVNYLPYCMAKAGVVAMTQGLAKQLAPHVLVNAIAPGPILRPSGLTRQAEKRALQKTLLKRWGSPQEMVNAVLYLAEGTAFMTGHVLVLDGGRALS